ncbi:MAG: helix-turn-helix domain-containing protein [Trueperaceae bacterium]
MPLISHRQMPPTARDAALARTSGQALAPYAKTDRPVKIRIAEDRNEQTLELPAGAVALLMDVLEAMAAGRGVTLIRENAELTTVQAADILNVSRPYLIKLLDENKIPHRKVGKHRRILMEDLMAYKARDDKERQAVLDELAREAQEEGYGY